MATCSVSNTATQLQTWFVQNCEQTEPVQTLNLATAVSHDDVAAAVLTATGRKIIDYGKIAASVSNEKTEFYYSCRTINNKLLAP
jgi:hypothetical protein